MHKVLLQNLTPNTITAHDFKKCEQFALKPLLLTRLFNQQLDFSSKYGFRPRSMALLFDHEQRFFSKHTYLHANTAYAQQLKQSCAKRKGSRMQTLLRPLSKCISGISLVSHASEESKWNFRQRATLSAVFVTKSRALELPHPKRDLPLL